MGAVKAVVANALEVQCAQFEEADLDYDDDVNQPSLVGDGASAVRVGRPGLVCGPTGSCGGGGASDGGRSLVGRCEGWRVGGCEGWRVGGCEG